MPIPLPEVQIQIYFFQRILVFLLIYLHYRNSCKAHAETSMKLLSNICFLSEVPQLLTTSTIILFIQTCQQIHHCATMHTPYCRNVLQQRTRKNQVGSKYIT